MQHIMKSMGQSGPGHVKPILEINPDNQIIKKMKKLDNNKLFADYAHLLYEQSILIEGGELKNPALFVQRMNKIMGKAL